MAIENGFADLHTHTTASDGLLPPAELVRQAKRAGLAAVAITDHDTVAGIAEALDEGERLGIMVVPGVEVSTVAAGTDIHILGYYTKADDPEWLQRLESLRRLRERRNQLIVDKLAALGIPISMEDVLAAARSGNEHGSSDAEDDSSVGRPHIAKALIQKGIVATMKEAFDRYLAAGAAAYASVPRLHPFEAIEWIQAAGGTAVIAHPGLYGNDRLVEEIIRHGAQGIEVYHSDHSEEDERRYARLADMYGLIVTGGSDFHGDRNGESYHGAVGSRRVPAGVLDRLRRE